MRRLEAIAVFFFSLCVVGILADALEVPWLKAPSGFRVELYAYNVPNARQMAFDAATDSLFVGSMSNFLDPYITNTSVYRISTSLPPDTQGPFMRVGDGKFNFTKSPREHSIVLANQQFPNGVVVINGTLFVSTMTQLLRMEFPDGVTARGVPTPIFWNEIPPILEAEPPIKKNKNKKRGNEQPVPDHSWKYLGNWNGRIILPFGAPCNTCNINQSGCLVDYPETDCIYGTINLVDPFPPVIPATLKPLMHGVRNSVGFDIHPETGDLWFTDNGRDKVSDQWPPDELNVWYANSPFDLHYGFPYCYSKNEPDASMNPTNSCIGEIPDVVDLPPHGAALALKFYTGTAFPEKYRGKAFISLHGSWNRDSTSTGYQILVTDTKPNSVPEVFLDGFLQFPGGKQPSHQAQGPSVFAVGRPVDILFMPDGSMLVSDDFQGAIYRITYVGHSSPDAWHIVLIVGGVLGGLLILGTFVAAVRWWRRRADGDYVAISDESVPVPRRKNS